MFKFGHKFPLITHKKLSFYSVMDLSHLREISQRTLSGEACSCPSKLLFVFPLKYILTLFFPVFTSLSTDQRPFLCSYENNIHLQRDFNLYRTREHDMLYSALHSAKKKRYYRWN